MAEWRRRKKPRRPAVYRRAAFRVLEPEPEQRAAACRCAHPVPRSEGPLLTCGLCARVVGIT